MLKQEAERPGNTPRKVNAVRALAIFEDVKDKRQSLKNAVNEGLAEDRFEEEKQNYGKALIEQCHREEIDPYMLAERWVKTSVQRRMNNFWSDRKRKRENVK
jgi:hypothetical protein